MRKWIMVQDTVKFFSMFLVYTVALLTVSVALTGCKSSKYYECVLRDRTANPCN